MKISDPDLIKIESVDQGAGEVPSIVAYVKSEITLADAKELYDDYKTNGGSGKVRLAGGLSWEADRYMEIMCEEWPTGEEISSNVRIFELGGYLG